ncbi:MAG: hypothetical protein UY48_C0002G0011 [Candidatus Gottesmanbacteria bacterium GW2011_GWB1_49_7]|uniref:Uncharacterized protein n=1 Tax=Candidatus Gottesmanbacteria bacterium GW2011_GWB1_49_7 TaxID=1618448 RepID=A0A0G1W416_9BACT|nr:MAG: hypothetical protein UY48_C0002G0011 [Candidatus Gottesmanbacteria bacterium GW2011_GWB1_49_7]
MRGYQARCRGGEVFAQRVFRELQEEGFTVVSYGTEHTIPDFMGVVRQSTDPVSLFLRFEPDGVIAYGDPPVSWYIELKASLKYEQTAYRQGMKRHDLGLTVACIFNCEGEIRWGFIEELRFRDSEAIVGQYQDPFPVIDGWIYPRQASHWEQIKWDNAQASGTPYKEVDGKKLREWSGFKRVFTTRAPRLAVAGEVKVVSRKRGKPLSLKWPVLPGFGDGEVHDSRAVYRTN